MWPASSIMCSSAPGTNAAQQRDGAGDLGVEAAVQKACGDS